jgi:3-hydroxybutyryl-CoA dehydratase
MKISRSIDEYEVGMKNEFSRKFTHEETITMGNLIWDHNPFHMDAEFAKKIIYKKPIVHGLLVAGMISYFGADIFPGPGLLAKSMKFTFLKPVYVGEEIRAVAEIINVDREKEELTFSMKCYNEKEIIVLEGEAKAIPFKNK